MSDIFDNLSDKIQNISNRVAKMGKNIFNPLFLKGRKLAIKEKLNLKLKS